MMIYKHTRGIPGLRYAVYSDKTVDYGVRA